MGQENGVAMNWDDFICDEACEAKLPSAPKHEEQETRDLTC